MTILPSLTQQFQNAFPGNAHGRERAHWFVLTLQAIAPGKGREIQPSGFPQPHATGRRGIWDKGSEAGPQPGGPLALGTCCRKVTLITS